MEQETYLPLFPLNIVVFPGEHLNLHIFEPRYRQLVKDCLNENMPFGIPSYIHNQMAYGTEVQLLKIEKTYESGEMDIKTIGKRIFQVKTFENPSPGKLYAGGEVEFMEDHMDENPALKSKMIGLVKNLFKTLSVAQGIEVASDVTTWDISHKIGLSQEQEYEMLAMPSEVERMAFVITHLEGAIPILREMERTKIKIQMNGHFKNFDALNF